jgi:hypothetical protein
MESLGEKSKSTKGFFKYLFNFDEDTKSDLLNIIQYSFLAIIPILLINKGLQRYMPDVDEEKGSLEIIAEILVQLIVMFVGLFYVNRIIKYIPTFSGMDYPDLSIVCIIASTLIVILSSQTRIGEKCNIIIDRMTEVWNGKMGNTKENQKKTTSKKTSQSTTSVPPVMSQKILPPTTNQNNYSDGTSIQNLPSSDNYSNPNSPPDFNKFYQQDNTPLVNASSPSPSEGFENGGGIMAANEALGGGGSFSSW